MLQYIVAIERFSLTRELKEKLQRLRAILKSNLKDLEESLRPFNASAYVGAHPQQYLDAQGDRTPQAQTRLATNQAELNSFFDEIYFAVSQTAPMSTEELVKEATKIFAEEQRSLPIMRMNRRNKIKQLDTDELTDSEAEKLQLEIENLNSKIEEIEKHTLEHIIHELKVKRDLIIKQNSLYNYPIIEDLVIKYLLNAIRIAFDVQVDEKSPEELLKLIPIHLVETEHFVVCHVISFPNHLLQENTDDSVFNGDGAQTRQIWPQIKPDIDIEH